MGRDNPSKHILFLLISFWGVAPCNTHLELCLQLGDLLPQPVHLLGGELLALVARLGLELQLLQVGLERCDLELMLGPKWRRWRGGRRKEEHRGFRALARRGVCVCGGGGFHNTILQTSRGIISPLGLPPPTLITSSRYLFLPAPTLLPLSPLLLELLLGLQGPGSLVHLGLEGIGPLLQLITRPEAHMKCASATMSNAKWPDKDQPAPLPSPPTLSPPSPPQPVALLHGCQHQLLAPLPL